jgi:predicted metal-dependent phosphotriesterase family hydrolase
VRAAGIETVVDATAYGLGRYIPRLQRINAEVDLNLIVATGVYAFLELPNSLPTAASMRSPSCSCERSAKESTTPASRPRSSSARSK